MNFILTFLKLRDCLNKVLPSSNKLNSLIILGARRAFVGISIRTHHISMEKMKFREDF